MSRLIKSFGFAAKGLQYALKTQPNFRFHAISSIIVLIAGIFFKIHVSEWLWILAAIALVLISELLNTAIEVLVDLISPEYNKQAGIVKDTAAAAVLVAAIIAVGIGVIIFLPKIF
ncbi:MAG: diacylglycerol kinase family protein [Pedobacter sp.]|nr:MAG: diacylglycerol kinase family protein [Pedobacter sp.]